MKDTLTLLQENEASLLCVFDMMADVPIDIHLWYELLQIKKLAQHEPSFAALCEHIARDPYRPLYVKDKNAGIPGWKHIGSYVVPPGAHRFFCLRFLYPDVAATDQTFLSDAWRALDLPIVLRYGKCILCNDVGHFLAVGAKESDAVFCHHCRGNVQTAARILHTDPLWDF